MKCLRIVLALCLAASPLAQAAVSNAFTYQGVLRDNGAPANGVYDFEFDVYLDNAAVTPVSVQPVLADNVQVTNGVFSARVDFGFGQFSNEVDLFLEVRVRPGASSGTFTALLPRQELTPAPFAHFAKEVRDGSVNITKIDPNSVQARIDSACGEGSVMRAVNSDGSVQCTGAGAGSTIGTENDRTTLDSSGNVGANLSMVVTRTGQPAIAYYDGTNGDLEYVLCERADCGINTHVTLDTAGIVGQNPSIINSLDQNQSASAVSVSYYDATNSALKVARCNTSACANVELRNIDTLNDVGVESSLHMNISGSMIAAYRDASGQQLKFAQCGSTGCVSISQTQVVDTSGNVGLRPILLTGTDGNIFMVYQDVSSNGVKLAFCGAINCATPTVSTLLAGTLMGSPLAATLGANGFPLIAGVNASGSILVVECTNLTCSTFNQRALGVGPAADLSIAVGPDGFPSIAYYYGTGLDLRYVRCRFQNCSGGLSGIEEVILDTTGDVGASVVLVIPPDGRPAMAYYDATNGDLEFYRCANKWCVSMLDAK